MHRARALPSFLPSFLYLRMLAECQWVWVGPLQRARQHIRGQYYTKTTSQDQLKPNHNPRNVNPKEVARMEGKVLCGFSSPLIKVGCWALFDSISMKVVYLKCATKRWLRQMSSARTACETLIMRVSYLLVPPSKCVYWGIGKTDLQQINLWHSK